MSKPHPPKRLDLKAAAVAAGYDGLRGLSEATGVSLRALYTAHNAGRLPVYRVQRAAVAKALGMAVAK